MTKCRNVAGLWIGRSCKLIAGFVLMAALSGCASGEKAADKPGPPPAAQKAEPQAPQVPTPPAKPEAKAPPAPPPPPQKPDKPAPPAAPPPPASKPEPAAPPPPPASLDATKKAMSEAEQQALADEIRKQIEEGMRQAQQNPPPPAPQTKPAPPSPSQPASTQPAAGGNPKMELSPLDFDFGTVWQGGLAQREFTIRNSGTAPLTVDAKSSCGCTVPTRPKTPLEPNETTTFTITYNTNHRGEANKNVTLTTNDPDQPQVVIKVHGQVKPIYAITPSESIVFQGAEANKVASQTVKLECQYASPLPLKLKEGQDLGRFDAELKEIKPGSAYELTVTTKPPLQTGLNRASIALLPSEPNIPAVTISVTAHVLARVMVTPTQLMVAPTTTQPTTQIVHVQYRTEAPLNLTGVNPTPDSIKCEVVPMTIDEPNARNAFYQIRVTLPPADQIPENAKIEVLTDDKEYPRFDIPVRKIGTGPTAPTPRSTSRPMPGK